jgi:uncharacterized protein (TIGR00251 family)
MIELREAEGGTVLRVRVQPRASRDGMAGEREGALLVRLTAPPVEGRANEALARLVARALDVPATAVTIVRGSRGRDKILHVAGLDPASVRARLEAA